jgi:hypothetical protein
VHERDWFFARKLKEMGVATLVLDSFAPRGLIKVFENKSSFGEREQAIDALTATEVLRKIGASTFVASARRGARSEGRLRCA